MIMTVAELRQLIETDEEDSVLELRLEALENTIQKYTNNNFREYVVEGVVIYPADIKIGVVNLMKWELTIRDKAGVASETISRHSVTYRDETTTNFTNGYPSSLMGFLLPYKKARFGRGISL